MKRRGQPDGFRDGGQDPSMNGGGSTPIGRSTEVRGFAWYPGPEVCLSRAGRWRKAHEFVGGTCIYCDLADVESQTRLTGMPEVLHSPK